MKPHLRTFLRLLLGAFLLVLLAWTALAQEESKAAVRPPDHPITEEQLRTYFKVCHFESVSRQLTDEKLEQQRKQLPAWYPSAVWDEITAAIDGIDLPLVALPVYQKYLGEEDAKWLIRFFATPQGQKLVQVVLTKDVQAQHAGDAPLEAREKTLAALQQNEGDEVRRVMTGINPQDMRDMEKHAARMQQLQPVLGQIRQEFAQAVIDKQQELSKAIVSRHMAEMVEARTKYEAAHPPASGETHP